MRRAYLFGWVRDVILPREKCYGEEAVILPLCLTHIVYAHLPDAILIRRTGVFEHGVRIWIATSTVNKIGIQLGTKHPFNQFIVISSILKYNLFKPNVIVKVRPGKYFDIKRYSYCCDANMVQRLLSFNDLLPNLTCSSVGKILD